MLGYEISGRSKVSIMPKENLDKEQGVGQSSAAVQHVTGAVTLVRSINVCGQNLMTASNPAANAAAAVVPAFVTVRFGNKD